ncbi:circadian clock-controlled protein daywake-like [Zerene cesonia]|uniref:circadian clock-controlled protein daywake-like n=1 Tax=Zerene cesonia TaxID=33412 RepID=UPI0018E52B20|nr:circadian clock-controlled protein daywake-like [Zerene cesonia]
MFHVVFLALYCLISNVLSVPLPEYIKVCKRDQSSINECVKNSVQSLRPNLIAGIPEINVPSIEPFYITEVVAINGDLAPLKASATNVKVSGAGNFSIKSLDLDLETYTIQARVRFPLLHLEGNYKMDAQILVIPLKGQGKLYADAVKCDADIELKTKVYERDGKQYMKFTSMTVALSLKDYNIRLTGLFNGDKALEEATNEAINQNRGEFLQAIKPYLEKTVAKVLLDSANKIVHPLPLEDLFPMP